MSADALDPIVISAPAGSVAGQPVDVPIVVRDAMFRPAGGDGLRITLEAPDGPSALAVLQSPQQIDLLVSDIGLPGLDGRQVVDAARDVRPTLKVLFMTGYAERATLADGSLEAGMEMIVKPFSIGELEQTLSDVLERSTDG